MSNGEITNTPATVNPPERQVIAIKGPVHHWIEPWYLAYAILGALASGLAAILIPLVVTNSGGSSTQLGAAIAALNIGALFAPVWGWAADRSLAYRAIFLSGFLLIAAGFLGFTVMHGFGAWLISAYLVGFGTGASNTVASLFVVEFTPENEWSRRISLLQTFNALGAILGMAIAGLLQPAFGTFVAALLVIPAILVGGWGLPVPRSAFHIPRLRLHARHVAHLARRGGPNAVAVVGHIHRLRLSNLPRLRIIFNSAFGVFLGSWFFFSVGISSFSSLYPVLMLRSFGVGVATSSMWMSIATLVSIPLYNLAGRLSLRYGPVQLLSAGICARMIALVTLGVVAYLHPSSPAVPAIVAFGLFQGIWPLLSVASNDLAAELAPIGEGTAMGLFNAAAAAASALGAITGGAVADRFGYESVNLFAAAGALLSLLCVLPLRNARRHSEFEESSSCSSSSSSSRIPIVSQSD
jgi:DHA1 family tetracycline resistance protein-like MFS transporter